MKAGALVTLRYIWQPVSSLETEFLEYFHRLFLEPCGNSI